MEDFLVAQLEGVIGDYEAVLRKSKYDDASDVLSDSYLQELMTRCLSALTRIAGPTSVYSERANDILKSNTHPHAHMAMVVGVVKSLRHDLMNGYLKTLEELIHGEIFGDYLEMADHLSQNGYKDAAAVLAGSTLEAHLKKLCMKYSVSTTIGTAPKKADVINSDLVKANAYSKLDQKNVTSWLGLRNDAAHGNYASYSNDQVSLLISSVRDFVTRHPA